MSDHTSQPSVKYCADKMNATYIHGRPEPELVPSRYALKVGEIDVMVISDGVLSLQHLTALGQVLRRQDEREVHPR